MHDTHIEIGRSLPTHTRPMLSALLRALVDACGMCGLHLDVQQQHQDEESRREAAWEFTTERLVDLRLSLDYLLKAVALVNESRCSEAEGDHQHALDLLAGALQLLIVALRMAREYDRREDVMLLKHFALNVLDRAERLKTEHNLEKANPLPMSS